jgi:hypothetical protein
MASRCVSGPSCIPCDGIPRGGVAAVTPKCRRWFATSPRSLLVSDRGSTRVIDNPPCCPLDAACPCGLSTCVAAVDVDVSAASVHVTAAPDSDDIVSDGQRHRVGTARVSHTVSGVMQAVIYSDDDAVGAVMHGNTAPVWGVMPRLDCLPCIVLLCCTAWSVTVPVMYGDRTHAVSTTLAHMWTLPTALRRKSLLSTGSTLQHHGRWFVAVFTCVSALCLLRVTVCCVWW